jgi:dTDP-4-amino-4,6-dideoxygalactose transaminase
MKVPLFDMTRQYGKIKQEVLQTLDGIFSQGHVILGENVTMLEKEIQQYLHCEHAVGVANGSDALLLAVHSLDLKQGDMVITTPYTFFATVSSITRNGALPVFADVTEKYYNIDLDMVEDILTTHPQKDRIKAFIPVHLFGKTLDLKRLEAIKEKYGIKIIEDNAQAIGSVWHDRQIGKKFAGTVGDMGTISFFPTKNLGAYGDAGMVITNDEKLAQRVKKLRVHGAAKRYYHDEIGYNSRIDEVQAAILRIKLKYLDSWIEKRLNIANNYQKLFQESGLDEFIVYPEYFADRSHVYHQYVITLKGSSDKNHLLRDRLAEYLQEKEIGTSVYYPRSLHMQKCFDYLGCSEGQFPVSERACEKTLALPIFPELTVEEQEYVVKNIKDFFKGI